MEMSLHYRNSEGFSKDAPPKRLRVNRRRERKVMIKGIVHKIA